MSAQSEAQTSGTFGRGRLLAALSLALALSAPACAGDWVAGPKSQARLVDGGFRDGARYALAQIRLSGEAVTYWRDPGDAGAPPTFDFADSENVGEADAIYPQPERIDEEGSLAIGYRHEVVFPIRLAAADPKKPIKLALKLDYAVCEKICIPVHAQLTATLPPEPQAPESQLLEDSLKQIPQPLEAEAAMRFASAEPAPPAGGKPRWRVKITGGAARDLFVEPPTGFYFDVTREPGNAAFLLTLAQHPGKKMRPELPLRVTVSGPAPVEFDLPLPPTKN